MEIRRPNEEHVKSWNLEEGFEVGEGVDVLELDDAQNSIVDRWHELGHRPALAVVEGATTSQAPQAGRGIPHCLDRRASKFWRVGLRNHHAGHPEVEVFEDNLAIVFANPH